MRSKLIFPMAMGLIMGPMLLAMAQGQPEASQGFSLATLGFIAAHVVLVLFAAIVVLFAARLSPDWRQQLAKLHVPTLMHMAVMLGSAAVSALAVHLYLNGGQ